MKFLFVGAYEYLIIIKEKGYSHMYDFWCYLINNTESMSLWTYHEFNETDIINFNPDIIWIFDCKVISDSFIPLLTVCKKLNKPITFLGDDVFYIKDLHECSNLYFIDAIVFLVKMDKLQKQYELEFNNKIIKHFSNPFINIEQFHAHVNNKKIYDITIYGSTEGYQNKNDLPLNVVHKDYLEHWKKINNIDELPDKINFYDFRHRVKNLLIRSNNYKLNIIDPSLRGCWECPIKGEMLSIEINKSYLALATRTCIDKCMQKYIEISASDTVIIGNIPTDFRDLFIGKVIEINDDMPDHEILAIIDEALKNKEKLEDDAKIFGEKIRCSYGSNTRNTLEDFLIISKEIIDEYNLNDI